MLPAWSSEHGAGVTPIASAPSTRPASPLPASALTENSTLHHAAKDAAPSGLNYKRCAVRRLIADLRLGHRKLANLKAADYLEYVTRYEKSATTDPAGELRSEHSASNASLGSLNLADFTTTAANTATVPAAGCISTDTAVLAGLVAGTTTAAAVDQMAVVVHENRVLNHACLLTLCCQLQMALGPECQRLEKAFKTIQYCDETGSVLRNGGNATLGGASGADSSGTGGYGSSGGGGSSGGSSAGSPFGQSASASASASSARFVAAAVIILSCRSLSSR